MSINTADFISLKDTVASKRLERKLLRSELRDINKRIMKAEATIDIASKSHKWIQEVAAKTQDQISGSIGVLITKALSAVFDDSYEFKVSFVPRRNKTECDLYYRKSNFDIDIFDAGGGVVDVTSFALRATFWMLDRATRPILILDEPFKFVSVDLQPYCGHMLKTISDELGIQIIMVSHIPDILKYADNIIKLSNIDDITHTS